MRRPTRITVFTLAAVTLTIAARTSLVLARRDRDPAAARVSAVAVAGAPDRSRPAPSEAERREMDIALYTRASEADPASAIFRAQLAGLYMQRARETGSTEDFARAERNARESLERRTQHNGKSFSTLAASLLAQHRFQEAFRVARQLVAGDSSEPSYRALLAETQYEVGDYDGARITLDQLPNRHGLSAAPRLARWAELTGRTDEARRILRRAAADADHRGDLPAEQRAWFHLRVGDVELRSGQLDSAGAAFRRGLAAAPDDHRLLGAMARLELARGHPREAAELGERALAVVLDPATLTVVGDAYAEAGDSARAEEYYQTMEVAISGDTGALHRAWSLSLLDRGRRVPEVLERAQRELIGRRDIYGYDVVAWALHASGRNAEARQAMSRALVLGTRDASLYYHAGMIEHALGANTVARRYLSLSLEIDPWSHPAQARRARAVLDVLAHGPRMLATGGR